jgi:MEDS: MEthanogen/methylotroph, DcmR Sensory domain
VSSSFDDTALVAAVEREGCPHLAVLLRTPDELLPLLAAFYALGYRRNGWLVHRAPPAEQPTHRQALETAGLPVAELEAAGRMAIATMDPYAPAEPVAQAWSHELDAALARGLDAGWYARAATGPDAAEYDAIMVHEAAWEACFHGRPVVTLCPFIVGALEPDERALRADALAEVHDVLLVPDGRGGLTGR